MWNPRCVMIWIVAVGLCSVAAQATILTFDVLQNGLPGSGSFNATTPYTTYGDNVNFGALTSGTNTFSQSGSSYAFSYNRGNAWTPDVTVAYTLAAGGIAHTIYNDAVWPTVDYLQGSSHDFTFTPSGGAAVRVNSFDLEAYFGASPSPQVGTWTLYQGSTAGPIINSGSWSVTDGNGSGVAATQSLISTGVTSFYTGSVVLEISQTTGTQTALDNLSFEEAAPEPASLTLLVLGGSLILRRRR